MSGRPLPLWCLAAGALAASRLPPGAPACGAEPRPPAVDYAKQVRPLLKQHCYACHGPETQEAGLRLDRKTEALAGGDSGPAILPGKPDESLLLELVRGNDPDRVMPPKGETLQTREIELLERWIAAGAAWPDDREPPSPTEQPRVDGDAAASVTERPVQPTSVAGR